ncbi:MAG: RNA polymerase sigma-54 factor [Pyrinomonas sp.]|uniref:RNA polymerase factor sigma-54 n=1 Tax=Pyrinomonas sp. TaxID=2080306 RepID=UPI00333474A8
MSVKLTTNLSQRLVLTPQLRQRIEMLQMTALELNELIQQQLLENPVLEEVPAQEEVREIAEQVLDYQACGNLDLASENGLTSNGTAADKEANEAVEFSAAPIEEVTSGERATETDVEEEESVGEPSPDPFEEVDFGREFQEYLDPGYKTQEYEHREDEPTFEQFLSRPPTLTEHLIWQLHVESVEDELIPIAECIIGNLDGDGRLTATNEEIAALGDWSVEEVERARRRVMQLDPVGCGARDAGECLLAQLEARGEGDRLAAQLIREHGLAELQPHRLPALARQLSLPLEELAAELEAIRQLDPFPGRRYSSDEPVLIVPEIFIEKRDDGEYEISFADDGGPRLRISQTYQQLLERPDTSKETKDFIKEKTRSAIELLRNIEHRRQTIYRVVECIVRRQREFLDKGVEYLKPMMLKDVAEETGMHLSTVSRVVNRKYAHTPQGVIELRRFFTEGMLNEDGEEVSTRIIKLKIKKLIEEEDPRNPITDDQVVKILAKEGIKLSRRTVAKYRDQMNIPGSRERRVIV